MALLLLLQRGSWAARHAHTQPGRRLAHSAAVKQLVAGIARVSPAFPVHGADVQVVTSPTEYYQSVLAAFRGAKRRIGFASLYLGNSELELALVDALRDAIRRGVEVHGIVDASRGTRGRDRPNSVDLLAPLIAESPATVQISCWRMPQLQGRWWMAPERYREGVAVFHMKGVVSDDSVLLTGANMSKDYFTNRQDRCMVLHDNARIADHMYQIMHTMLPFGLKVHSDGCVDQQASNTNQLAAAQALQTLQTPAYKPLADEDLNGSADSTMFISMQMPPYNIRQDEQVTRMLLDKFYPHFHVDVATGYFNLPRQYIARILTHADPHLRILTAGPKANGFFNGRTISGALPSAYTQLAKRFVSQMEAAGKLHATMWEYEVPGWTFHAKGAWFSLAEDPTATPVATLVGSPNFGRRSVERDMELQTLLVTSSSSLQASLKQERDNLFAHATQAISSTFHQPHRSLRGWSWASGSWIHVGTKVVAPYL